VVSRCGSVAIVVGEELPAMSVSFADPRGAFSGFVVIFSEYEPGVDDEESMPSATVCLHCLVEDGDEQLARGLDLARVHGQVDFDREAGEWYLPGFDRWLTGGGT
jgi:hypothetical protein